MTGATGGNERDYIRHALDDVDGLTYSVAPGSTPTEVYVSDVEDLVDVVARISKHSFLAGVQFARDIGETLEATGDAS